MNKLYCSRCGNQEFDENGVCLTCGLKAKKHVCPVCGKYMFSYPGSFDVCEVCGWEDDPVQEDDPDYSGGANRMSLNEARAAYKEGREIE